MINVFSNPRTDPSKARSELIEREREKEREKKKRRKEEGRGGDTGQADGVGAGRGQRGDRDTLGTSLGQYCFL